LLRLAVADGRDFTPANPENQVGASKRAIEAIYRPIWTKPGAAEMLPPAGLRGGGRALQLPRTLVEGHLRFRRDEHAKNRGRYLQLAELGQTPTAMVIACCDARVDVSAIFDAEPGSLFIMRNVANLVPPYEPEGKYHGTSAAVEYAATALKVPHIIVLGHSNCGGVNAYRRGLRDNLPEQGFIGSWLTLLDGLRLVESDTFAYGDEMAFELAAVRSSLANLGNFPFIKQRMEDGLLALHGLHFDLGSGQLLSLEPETQRFMALTEA
jgi:carbonic anhydrase